jgi:heptosyltransferase III
MRRRSQRLPVIGLLLAGRLVKVMSVVDHPRERGRTKSMARFGKNPNILVITLRRLGDALLTTPLIRSLRRAWPDGTIDALVFSSMVGILKGNPDIDRIIPIAMRSNFWETLGLMRGLWKRYDLAISTQNGDRPTVLALSAGRTHAGIVSEDGKIGSALKRWALHYKAPTVANIHRVEQVLLLADLLGIARVPEVVCPAAATSAQVCPTNDYAVIHAAPMFRYKQWTREGWRALAANLRERGLEVVAISGPDPAERAYLDDLWQDVVPVREVRWPELVSLLRGARVYVGPDTSVSHLAAATGCPTVVLFGPMDPRLWGPWPVGGLDRPWAMRGTVQRRGNVWVVQNPLPCLPCTFEGCERHIASYSRCLDELTPSQVMVAVDEALAKTRIVSIALSE